MTESMAHCLFLIVVANGTPVLVQKLFAERFNRPVDMGLVFLDGKRVLGDSKTWRGLISAIVVTALVSILLDYDMQLGALLAGYAMLGDLLSSFIKRRLGMPASSMAPFLDQVPESLLPAWLLQDDFDLDAWSVVVLVCLFVVLELLLSRILYQWGIRRKPY
ncbi:MAG: CDP-archaeol synthase [Gammaproteobacteria bacterium]|nr:MAG: CDP-archaeol synthase [Gammaproteobacteria bacterium]